MNGFINLNKPADMTSNDALNIVKRLLRRKYGVKFKIGHAGTLDPMAEGVLPIAVAEATKAIAYLQPARKTYVFDIVFGAKTDTDDKTGEILAATDKIPSEKEIKAVIPSFLGDISQVPPSYSAVKVQGRRAYDLARQGADFDLAPRANHIYSLTLQSKMADNIYRFEVEADTGFYVRSLARDMAIRLGSLGHAGFIFRTRSGAFDIKDSISLDKLRQIMENPANSDTRDYILDISSTLVGIPAEEVGEDEARRLRNGNPVDTGLADGIYKIFSRNRLIAIGQVENLLLRPGRVFNIED